MAYCPFIQNEVEGVSLLREAIGRELTPPTHNWQFLKGKETAETI